MVGRHTWRKSGTFLVGVAACSALLFALGAARPQAAGDLFERLRDGVRNGIRTLTGRGEARTAQRPAVVRAESARAYALEMDRLARDRNLLRLPAADVDPLSDGGVPVDTRLPAGFYAPVTSFVAPPPMVDPDSGAFVPGDVEYWILQYGENRSNDMQDELEQLGGAEIVGFWPNAAYLVRLDSGSVGSARNLPAVRWSGRFHPSYKVDARLRDQLAAGDDPSRLIVDDRGMMRLQVSFHRGVHGEAYRDLVEAVPGLEILALRNDSGTDAAALVELPPAALADALVQLAQMRDVRAVDLNEVPSHHNDHSVWWTQSGISDLGLNNFDTTARLFALGLNGRGFSVIVFDDGLENDLCYYRYTDNLEDVTYQTLDTGMSPYPEGGDLSADRTRLRKVSAYIVYDGAQAYSSDIQHGTGTAGCAVGDNYGHNTTGGSLAARPLIRDLGRQQNLTTCEDPALDWSVGQVLRLGDTDMVVDDVAVADPTIVNGFGVNVQHHDARDGMAPGAHLVFGDIGNLSGGLTGTLFGFQAVNDAWGYSATSMNMSFGGGECDNCYTGSAPAADLGAWLHRMVVPFSSAGNSGAIGTSTIGAGFAQGKNVVTVGATERANSGSGNGEPRSGENVASYSSRGPKSGGLLAPEICVPGSVVTTANDSLAVNPEDGTDSGDGGCVGQQGFVTGTSFSSPTAAGLGVLVQQYFMDGWYPSGAAEPSNAMRPTNALVRAVLVNSARNLHGIRTGDDPSESGDRPTFGQGWGAPRLDDTLFFEGDPIRGEDPFGDTQRARMIVLTDTPNGLNDTGLLLREPGGLLRSEIVQNFQPAITADAIHEFPLNVIKNPSDPMDPADELRITMCYADVDGSNPTGRTTVNDLDLEAISPSGVAYRTNPLVAWEGGYTKPALEPDTYQEFEPFVGFTDFPDRDPNNTCENIFIAPENVEQGTWTIRVIGYDVPGNGRVRNDATPNFVNDQAASVDTSIPCDGIPDVDVTDQIFSNRQGYALLVSGNFTTTQGTIALNRTSFLCEGGELTIQVTDENGDSMGEPPCGPRTAITVNLITTIPNAGFTRDREIVTLDGTAPIYATRDALPIEVVSDPDAVVHGDGIIQIVEGEQIIVSYVDNDPCMGRAVAQATVACRPSVSDQGFVIEEGCDRADALDPMSDVRPDGFMDSGELNVYTARFANNGGEDLNDVIVSLRPDPEDPLMLADPSLIQVLNSPQPVGLAPPGRISDARFLVQMGDACSNPGGPECDPLSGLLDGIPPQYSMEFIVCVTSPEDGLLYPDCFRQTQSLEADIESFRYDTRDPAGELYGLGRIERQIAGPENSMDPNDYIENAPMWFDPGADFDANPGNGVQPCISMGCDVDRADWDAANLANPGSGAVPPPECFFNCRPGLAEDEFNPYDPWDFEDDDEGFIPAAYDGDPNQVGPPGATGGQEWFWKNAAMGGGGCGWENEIIEQLDSLGPGVHPDVAADPWGIWHTGAINASTAGPYPDASPPNQGVPHNDDEADANYRTILWRPDGAVNDNSGGEWCNSYISNTALADFYRSFLIPPRLFKVHATDPEFRVEFREWRTYTRMDGHTIDGDNLAIAGWYFSNDPVDPISFGPRTHSWAQYEYGTLIFTDDVRDDWPDDDTFVDENLRTLDPSFTDYTYEDFFGPASQSWDMALTWAHLHFGGFASGGEYGWGIDDFSFVWTESRDIEDRGDCGDVANPVQPPLVFFGESRYNACAGDLNIVVRDPVRTEPQIAVCVTSAVEDFEVAYLEPTGVPGEYRGTLPYNADPRFAADGVLSILAGQVDVGRGADTAVVEYDPGNVSDWNPMDGAFTVEGACDWQDMDGDGRNDEDIDGTIIAEDGLPTGRNREVRDAAAMNCTSGLVYVIKHELRDAAACGSCDGDRFADRGETVWMSVQIASQLGATLEDVEVTISTDDDTVCILQDTVRLDELEGGNVLTDTPIAPSAEPGRQGFLFAVPASVRTDNLEDPKKVTFRIDVKGLRQDNLNEFTTFGDGFNSYLPLETTLFLDLDDFATTADYADPVAVPPRAPGEFLEGFEGPAGFGGYDHPRTGGQPGWALQPLIIDATMDTRFGADLNNGFCPECTDCVIGVDEDCEYAFDGGPMNFSQWQFTNAWAYSGLQAMKFGEPGAGPMRQDQSYQEGQYTAIESPPLFLANDAGITPELSFRHVADFWQVSFTGGLNTVLGSGVLELSANPAGLPLPIQRAQESEIRRVHPQDSFVRLYPYENGYDSVTDALNACRTLYCGYHHPVFGRQGDPLNESSDERAGARGGTWEEVRVDLSDWKGMQVVVRWTVAVLQDLDIQSGRVGWLLDDIRLEGVGTRSAFALESGTPAEDPCGIIATVETTSADCFGEEVYVFDRHSGLGMFDSGTGSPFPIEYEWSIGSATIRGFGDEVISGETGFRGRYENPIIRLSSVAGIGGPGSYTLNLRMYQDGVEVGSTSTPIVYKDAPVPAIALLSDGPYAGSQARFQGSASVLPSPDPARDLVYIWDFGDGSAIDTSGPFPNHVFENEGSFDVTLCVRDEDNCESCTTQRVDVAAAPSFGSATTSFVTDCADPATPAGIVGDGNPDYNEYVTFELSFTNAVGAAPASDVVGYLSSADRDVEIVQDTAFFGAVAPGASSTPQPFTFILRDDGSVPTCLVVPFRLTLVANGGTVVQDVPFAFTMGQGVDVEDVTPMATLPCSFQFGDDTGGCELTKPGVPGCLDGIRVSVDITGTNLATVGEMNVTLFTPSGRAIGLHFGDGANAARDFQLEAYFDVDAGGPIPDTGGELIEAPAGILPAVTRQTFVDTLTGEPLDFMGGGEWRIVVAPRNPIGGVPGSVYTVNSAVIDLEGKESTDLEIAVEETDCSSCVGTTTPIYEGLTASCVPGQSGLGALTWPPAVDPTTCGTDDDLEYALYVSATAGQLGDPVMSFLDPATQTCDVDCPGGGCAFERAPGASTWRVCGLQDWYWTVVVNDGGDAATRVPAVSAPADAVPAGYQSLSVNCVAAPMGPVFTVTRSPSGTYEAWVEDPMGAGNRTIQPALREGTGTVYTMFRGSLASLWSVSQGDVAGYDHETIVCSANGPSVDLGPQPGRPDEPGWYYLMPAAGTGGCGGLGYRGTPGPGSGLQFIEGRPNGPNTASCPPAEADCLP